jgi:hypothetical protein
MREEIHTVGVSLVPLTGVILTSSGSDAVSRASCAMTVMLWTLLIVLLSLTCALSDTQIPFRKPADNNMVAHGTNATFKFEEGSDVFTPKDLVELSRPGSGVANVPGDLILVPVSKYSFEDKKYVRVSSVFRGTLRHVCSGWMSVGFRDVRASSSRGAQDGGEMCRKHMFLQILPETDAQFPIL